MSSSDHTCDLLIIGAGPAGCTAALYGARAGLHTIMISPTELSGMMSEAAIVGNFPGFVEPVSGREILRLIRQQALNAGAEHLLEPAEDVDFSDLNSLRVTAGHSEHVCKALIVATGAMSRAAKVPGEEEYQGLGVCYCVACDGPLYQGEDVLVVGDDHQAAEEAMALSRIADKVQLVTPGKTHKIPEETQQAMSECGNLFVSHGLKLQEIVGDDAVTGAEFVDSEGQKTELDAAGIFLYMRGSAPAIDFLKGTVETDDRGFIITDELGATTVPGVFAAGDVRRKDIRQMVVAAGEGATAALSAERHINKRSAMRQDRGEGRS